MLEEKKSQKSEIKEKEKISVRDNYFSETKFLGKEISLEEMFSNGVHFGHKKFRRHPKMNEYIFSTRKGIDIINLEKTIEKLKEAMEFVRQIKKEGKQILFISTGKQTADIAKEAALACGAPFVVGRWLGGTFTNFKTIKERTKYLKNLEEKIDKGELKKYTKLERMKKEEEREKLESRLGGIKNMEELPGAIFSFSAKEDILPIKEANQRNIPVIALVDSNADPSLADYPIPCNDNAVSAVNLIAGHICRVIMEK